MYSSSNIIQAIKSRRMGGVGHVTRLGERRGANRILVGKPEGKRQLGRPRPRSSRSGLGGMDLIDQPEDRDR
jgi:hypothetical protein